MSGMRRKLMILETHPIQYRVPIYQRMQELRPGSFKVCFGTDCSVRGHFDVGFGREVAWNIPLLSGFDHAVLHNQRGPLLSGRRSLSGRGLEECIKSYQPDAILLNGLYFQYDFAAYWHGRKLEIPLWLRSETQDHAFQRGAWKNFVRTIIYQKLYQKFSRFFYIGELNRQHYLTHGVTAAKLSPARYCVKNPFEHLTVAERQARRAALRAKLNLGNKETLFAFFGKLIPKKGPEHLLTAWRQMPEAMRRSSRLMYVGSGAMEAELRQLSADLPVIFTGFINQRELPDYYLAADVVVLPSRQMGETWGLVINEALLAGCRTIISSACGCAGEFTSLPHVRVFNPGEINELTDAMVALTEQTRDFQWAEPFMANYSIDAAARALLDALD